MHLGQWRTLYKVWFAPNAVIGTSGYCSITGGAWRGRQWQLPATVVEQEYLEGGRSMCSLRRRPLCANRLIRVLAD